MPKDKPLEVKITDVHSITERPLGRQPTTTHLVTFKIGDSPELTVFIAEAEDTPENRAKLIREKWLEYSKFKPEIIRI